MISGLKPYSKMKDSGAPWLGQVPDHWSILPNRALFNEIDDRGHNDEEMLSVTISRGVLRQADLLAGSSKKDSSNLDRASYKLVEPGDLTYNKMRAWQGAIGASSLRGIVSPAYVVERPRDHTYHRYFHFLLRTPMFAKEAERWSYGIASDMWSLRPEHFKNIRSCLPPIEEQEGIVRFLDYVDRRIRRYIAAKQKLIKLLEEQKQAIIHRAVTRGLDPNVRLKPSGVEWLGDMPEHWEVKRLRYLIEGRLTYGATAAAEHTEPTWPRYLRITDFDLDGRIRDETFRSLRPDLAKDYLLKPGDVLFARSGATVGKAFLVTKEAVPACHAGYLIRARPLPVAIAPAFLFAFFQSPGFARWRDSTFIIATIQNIAADKYADLPVPLPPLSEQFSILDSLGEDTGKVLAAVDRARREISLLREYRTRLIADVVTGKVDVREAVASLSDEGDELKPFEEPLDFDDSEEQLDAELADDLEKIQV